MPKATPQQPTTGQSLGALLKSARDIMRKDKGLNGDFDRLRLLTRIMSLKVPPVSSRGNGNEIMGKFGGADNLRNPVNRLQSLLWGNGFAS